MASKDNIDKSVGILITFVFGVFAIAMILQVTTVDAIVSSLCELVISDGLTNNTLAWAPVSFSYVALLTPSSVTNTSDVNATATINLPVSTGLNKSYDGFLYVDHNAEAEGNEVSINGNYLGDLTSNATDVFRVGGANLSTTLNNVTYTLTLQVEGGQVTNTTLNFRKWVTYVGYTNVGRNILMEDAGNYTVCYGYADQSVDGGMFASAYPVAGMGLVVLAVAVLLMLTPWARGKFRV